MADESSGSSSPTGDDISQNEASGGSAPSGNEEVSDKPKPGKKVAKTSEDKPGASAPDSPKSDGAGKGRKGSKSGKKVATTMLEIDVSGLMSEVEKASQLQAGQPAESASGAVEDRKEAAPDPGSQPKSGSKTAKTMLEHDVSGLMDEIERMSKPQEPEVAEPQVMEPEPAPAPSSGSKTAKTMLEHDVSGLMDQIERMSKSEEPESTESEASPESSVGHMPEMPPPPPPAHHEKGKDPVAKTMLDHAVLWDQVAKAAQAEEVRVAEQLKERANEPVKPFQAIEKYKKSTPCSSIWENSDGKERFSFCTQCQLQVYDFSGMELPEAEELIFKRENRKNFTLYKRLDEKYLTSDCPVGIKKKRDLVMATVGGIALVACVLGVLLMMPKPAPPSPSPGPDVTAGGGGGYYSSSTPSKSSTEATNNNSQNNSGSKGATGTGTAANVVNQPDANKNQAGTGTDANQPDANGYWEFAPKTNDADLQPAGGNSYPTQPVPQPTVAPAHPNAAQPAPDNSQSQPAQENNQPQSGATTAQPQPAPATAQPQSNGVQYYGR